MPPRGPRSLFFQVEYFHDHDFQTTLDAEAREAYLGIAQLADDEGWLEWVPQQIAYHVFLFREKPLEVLERVVAALTATRRVRIYACGHAQLLRWGQKRRHVGRHLAPDGSVAEAHRAHAKRSRNVLATSKKLGGPPAETSGSLGTSSHSHSSSHSTNGRARARGGAPRSMKEALKDYGYEPGNKPLSQRSATGHD